MSASHSPHVNSPLIDSKDVQDETDLVVPTSVTTVSAVHHTANPRRFEPVTPINGRRWKPLLYQDFVSPRGKKEDRDRPPEPFSSLVERANDWLSKNKDLHIRNCETLMRMCTTKKSLHDPEQIVLTSSMSENMQTHYLRGLRLWLCRRSKDERRQHQKLCVRDFLPDKHDSIQMLVSVANKTIEEGSLKGRVITTETVSTPFIGGKVDSDRTTWTENSNDDIPHLFVLRVFYFREDKPVATNIGIKDFVPMPMEDSFEGFGELTERANMWLSEQPEDVCVTNMMSVMVQKDEGPHSETGSSCYYVVPGMQGDTNIEYFRILRVAFTKGQKVEPQSPEHIHHSTCPISYETFTPAIVRPRHGKSADRMEKMKETSARISEFLKTSLADVLCVETVINPLEMVQSDAGGDASKPEHEMRWLLTTRLFISGPVYQYDPEFGEKLAKHSIRHERRKRKEESGHQPIFLRHVVTRRFKYRMLIAAGALIVCMTIIVALSVVYSNM